MWDSVKDSLPALIMGGIGGFIVAICGIVFSFWFLVANTHNPLLVWGLTGLIGLLLFVATAYFFVTRLDA